MSRAYDARSTFHGPMTDGSHLSALRSILGDWSAAPSAPRREKRDGARLYLVAPVFAGLSLCRSGKGIGSNRRQFARRLGRNLSLGNVSARDSLDDAVAGELVQICRGVGFCGPIKVSLA